MEQVTQELETLKTSVDSMLREKDDLLEDSLVKQRSRYKGKENNYGIYWYSLVLQKFVRR
jgi:hypothetical protein